MRRAVPAQVRTRAAAYSFPAPVRGLIEDENLAANGGQGCSVAENVFPLQYAVRLRGGHLKSATVGSDPVLTLIPYKSGGVEKLFAATETAVYDISLLNPTVAPSAALSSMTSGRWSYVQFGISGSGEYLVMCNGADSSRYYDGSAWHSLTSVSTPIAITGVASNLLSFIWKHGSRIWVVKKGTTSAWYLPVDNIGGALTEFSLGGVFRDGGALLFGTTWSGDSGDGMDDRQVFISDQGEVAVYEGTDPSDASKWSLVGRYDMGRPVGTTTIRAGGDVLIATVDGIVAISSVVTKDPAALSLTAVTKAVEPSWKRAVRKTETEPIQLLKWQRETMGIVGLPNDPNLMLVVNMQTGAWAKWSGMNVQCMAIYNDLAYFGSSDGKVYLFEGSGADNLKPYTCKMSFLPDPLRAPGVFKRALQARATFRAGAAFTPLLSLASDYRTEFPPAPNAAADATVGALWDVATWDVDKWDTGPDSEARQTRSTLWTSVVGNGFTHAPQVQVTCGSTRKPDAELVSFDLTYTAGGTVV